MVGLISQIPKDLFEVVIITNRGQRDPISKIIESMADKILYLSDKIFQTQEDIGESQLDVLFYADIGMDIRTYFLAFARLARTQCVFWGHPDTTGIPNIDYFLSSSLIEPRDGDQHYTETLRQFASLPTYYARPDLPSRLKSRDEFGLSEDQNLYLCPQSAIKFHPDIDNIFLQILESDQNSRLLVLEGAVKNWTSLIQNRWKRTIGRIGERIDVIPRLQQDDFLALQAISDVILDTPHFSGGNTSYEAFSLSKPVVTLDGSFMRGRVTAGMYRCIGVNNCTAASSSDYAEIAVKLGTNQDYRKLIEERIKESSDELFKVDLILEEFIQFIESAIE